MNIHENVARISGDKFLIREAIDNLIKNAVDLSSKNGEIDISLSCSNGSAVIQIKDHGTGIPGYAQERVFEKFYSLPRPSGGRKSSGLGLSIVRQITCLHNGTVKLANNQNSGAFAMLRFPVKTA
ncbi:MAG: GHKL domain-containing protein [Lentisphaerae bacterium]|nr:GHKL domain-containing protein [Lentisphaerota bacterium]MCP4100115.1 GHKL domain-containing protein [Lentisphaerota bacterium]